MKLTYLLRHSLVMEASPLATQAIQNLVAQVIKNLVAQSKNSRLGQPMLIAILLNLSLTLFCGTPLVISYSHSED